MTEISARFAAGASPSLEGVWLYKCLTKSSLRYEVVPPGIRLHSNVRHSWPFEMYPTKCKRVEIEAPARNLPQSEHSRAC